MAGEYVLRPKDCDEGRVASVTQVLDPSPGFVEVAMTPSVPVEAHKDAVGQEMSVSPTPLAAAHFPAAVAGWRAVRMKPSLSSAPQNDSDGHEIATSGFPPLMCAAAHDPAPPAGSVEVTALASESTAAQNEVDGHETPVNGVVAVMM